MKRIAIGLALALAFSGHALAQDDDAAPQKGPPAAEDDGPGLGGGYKPENYATDGPGSGGGYGEGPGNGGGYGDGPGSGGGYGDQSSTQTPPRSGPSGN